eukprot:1913693-Rhodomonas_salina.3
MVQTRKRLSARAGSMGFLCIGLPSGPASAGAFTGRLFIRIAFSLTGGRSALVYPPPPSCIGCNGAILDPFCICIIRCCGGMDISRSISNCGSKRSSLLCRDIPVTEAESSMKDIDGEGSCRITPTFASTT